MIFQKKCNIPESYNCVSVGNCQDPGDGSGQYTSLSQCVTSCVSTNIDEFKEDINVYPNPCPSHMQNPFFLAVFHSALYLQQLL